MEMVQTIQDNWRPAQPREENIIFRYMIHKVPRIETDPSFLNDGSALTTHHRVVPQHVFSVVQFMAPMIRRRSSLRRRPGWNRWSKTLPRRQSQQSCKLDMVEQNKRYWTWTTMIRLDAVGSFLGSAMWCWNEVFWGLYFSEMQGFQTNIRNKLCNKHPHWCQVKLSPTFWMEVHHPKWWSDVVRIHRMVDKWAWFGAWWFGAWGLFTTE